MLLSACALLPGGGGKKGSGSSSGSASGSGSNPSQSSSQSGGGGGGGGSATLPTEHGEGVDTSSGTHSVTLDFNENWSDYKSDFFGTVDVDTGLIGGHLSGLATMTMDCYIGYNSTEKYDYLMLKNKKGTSDAASWYSVNGAAFIGNCVTLGAIQSVEVTITKGSSASAKYDVVFSNSLSTSAATGGTVIDGSAEGKTETVTPSSTDCGFFKITCSTEKYNGQISSIKITYTI